MPRLPIGNPHGNPEIPRWTKIPGFDLSLNSLPLNTSLTYDLEPRSDKDLTSLHRGVWDNDNYKATVRMYKRGKEIRKLLSSDKPHTFIFHAKKVLGRDSSRWIITVPKDVYHDGSTVSIARFWTGSGISRDLAPSGLLHDKLTRWWLNNEGKIPVRFSINGEIQWVEVTIDDMALIWGASVQYLTPRPDWMVRVMEWGLKTGQPILNQFADHRPWSLFV